MASKKILVWNLEQHRQEGARLFADWDGAPDEATARACHDREQNDWVPALMKLIRALDPALVARYTILSPFESPRPQHVVLMRWPEIAMGFHCLGERLHRLRDDVVALAGRHRVDLTTPPVARFGNRAEAERAFGERVAEGCKATGGAYPFSRAADEAWGRQHGIERRRVRAWRAELLTHDERRGGRPHKFPIKS